MLNLQMVIYGYSLLILLFLLFDSKKNKDLYSKTSAWFRRIIYATMIILVLEASTFAFDGLQGKAMYWAVYLSNSILFLFNLLPISLWLVYVDECILTDSKEKERKRIIYLLCNVFVIMLVIANIFFKELFTVNAANQYVRGWAVYLIMALNMILYFGYIPSLIKYKKFLSGRIYELILALGLFPIIGAIVQMLWYGTPLVWPMMALVALAAHILIEREEIRRDSLTGLLSRTQLIARAQFVADRRQAFSLIMLDIDRFKSINDMYGHDEGDQALCVIANLLIKSIKQIDSAYRYAGDEFVLIIESDQPEAALRVIERLENNLVKYNKSSQKEYCLTFSSGAVYFDGKSEEKINDLIAKADDRMYQSKRIKYLREKDLSA